MLCVQFRVEDRIAWIKISLNIGLWSEELAHDEGHLDLIPATIENRFSSLQPPIFTGEPAVLKLVWWLNTLGGGKNSLGNAAS